jgi:hypothetical protein
MTPTTTPNSNSEIGASALKQRGVPSPPNHPALPAATNSPAAELLEAPALSVKRAGGKSARVFHPAEFIYDELLARGWTTWAVVQAAGGNEVDCCALDLYLCIQNPNLRIGGVADTLAMGFDVSPELFRNLEQLWLDGRAENDERFDVPEWIFGASPLQPTPPAPDDS